MDKAKSTTTATSTAQTTANTANSTANTAKTNAATAQSKADSAYKLANTANSTASSAKSTAEADASTTDKGRVQLNSAVNSTVENQAATAKADITETYESVDGLSQYRKWSNGFIEQGGYVESTGSVKVVTNFITPFKNSETGKIKVFKQLGFSGNGYATTNFNMIYVQVWDVIQTSFTHQTYLNQTGGSCVWLAYGY